MPEPLLAETIRWGSIGSLDARLGGDHGQPRPGNDQDGKSEQGTYERPLCRTFRDGSDGTRTRDLRRDRPRKVHHDPPRDDSEEPD